MPKRGDRPFELFLWGATGYTGRLAAEWLATRYADARIAIGGRSKSKLEKVRDDLVAIDPRCAAWAIRVGDAFDVPALDAMVPEAEVVATTVGPYWIYGHELAAACARHGTDYCDVTGEVPFVRALIDRNHERARASGARLVPFCGFDSIPSDLGVYLLQEHARETRGAPCADATYVLVRAMQPRTPERSGGTTWRRRLNGGVSGGTATTAIVILEAAGRDAHVREMLHDPYALADGVATGASDAHGTRKIDGSWTAPFVMGAVNSRVVHRSNALLGLPYGEHFRYEERVALGAGARGFARAQSMSAGLALGERVLSFGPLRSLVKRFIPSPGEGPDRSTLENGSFHVRIHGHDGSGQVVASCDISGQTDPGYRGAAKMLVESALCLAREVKPSAARAPQRLAAGVLTPAAAMGGALIARLRDAGIGFEIVSST